MKMIGERAGKKKGLREGRDFFLVQSDANVEDIAIKPQKGSSKTQTGRF